MVSASFALACASTYSSFLTLLPPNPNERASSRLTRSLGCAPSAARRRDISSTAVGSVNSATRDRSSTGTLFLGGRCAAAARDLIRLDLAGVEATRAADHLVDRLVEVRDCLALETQRVDARHDECLEVRALQSARLHALDGLVHDL